MVKQYRSLQNNTLGSYSPHSYLSFLIPFRGSHHYYILMGNCISQGSPKKQNNQHVYIKSLLSVSIAIVIAMCVYIHILCYIAIDTDRDYITIYLYIQLQIQRDLSQELVRMIIEAKMSHNLPSASWRAKKTGGVIRSKSEGLRIGGQQMMV